MHDKPRGGARSVPALRTVHAARADAVAEVPRVATRGADLVRDTANVADRLAQLPRRALVLNYDSGASAALLTKTAEALLTT